MKKNCRIKAGIITFLITLIPLNISRSEDWSDDQYLIFQEGQVLTGESLRDIMVHKISLILKIIALAIGIISLCVVLKTKDKEQRKKRKKVGIIATVGAVLISIIYDLISWWFRIQNQQYQSVYGVRPQKVNYAEDTIYSLPEPKTDVINVIVILARWIISVITFIIGIVSFIRILMTKDKELKKKRIRNASVILGVLIILIVIISVVARLLNK